MRYLSLQAQFLEHGHATSIALQLARVALDFFISPARCWQREVGEEVSEATAMLRSILHVL